MSLIVTTLLAALAWAGSESKMPGDLVRFLKQAKAGDKVELIVQFKTVPGEAQHKRVRALGGELRKVMPVIESALYVIPAGKVKALAEDPEVVRLSPNRGLSAPKLVDPE